MRNPFQDKFKLAKNIDHTCTILSAIALLLSLLSAGCPHELYGVASGLVAVFTVFLDFANKYIISLANCERIDDLIDNSFEIKLAESRSEGYYTNDNTTCGIERLALNSCESCFYTKRILKKERKWTWSKSIITASIIIFIALIGFNTTLTTILQASLPLYFFVNAILSEILIFKLNEIERSYRSIYNKSNNSCKVAELMLCVLKYENIMSSHKVLLSEEVYEKNEKELSNEWNSFKEEYKL